MLEVPGYAAQNGVGHECVTVSSHRHKVIVFAFNLGQYFSAVFAAPEHDGGLYTLLLQCLKVCLERFLGLLA